MATPRLETEVKGDGLYTESCYCPVTMTPFQAPVVLTNGKTVEEQVALKWFHELNKKSCPISREPLKVLQSHEYVKNYTLLNVIQEFQARLKAQQTEFETRLADMEAQQILKLAKEREKSEQLRNVVREFLDILPKYVEEFKRAKQQLDDVSQKLSQLKNQRRLDSHQISLIEKSLRESCNQIRAIHASFEKVDTEFKADASTKHPREMKEVEDEKVPLIQAVINDQRSEIKKLCQHDKVDVNAADSEGNTALHHAIACHNVWAIKFLIGAGANIFLNNHQRRCPDVLGYEKYGKEWSLWKYEYKGLSFFSQRRVPSEMAMLDCPQAVTHLRLP